MNRRNDQRKPRRLPVRYRRPDGAGGATEGLGYTVNVSEGGLFVATGRPLPSGSRVRLEVGEDPGFVVEAVVAHSHRVAPELRKLGSSGMGLRFLGVGELLAELEGERPGPGRPAGGERSSDSGATVESPDRGEDRVWRLRFRSPEAFLRVYRRDMVHAGLFIPTERPAPERELITVEIAIAGTSVAPLRLDARVVHRTSDGPTGGGMGVELEPRDEATARLRELADGLSGTP